MKICSICKEEFTSSRENAHLCDDCEKKMAVGITLTFPEGCEVIEEGALESPFLYRLMIPDTVKTVNSAFGNWLEEIVIPDSVIAFHPPLCFASDAIRIVKLGRGVTEIPPKAFLGKRVLCDVTLAEGLTAIGDNAFYSCVSLKVLSFPRTLKRIGNFAFAKAGLSSMRAGRALSHIGKWAFKEVESLDTVDVASDEGLTVEEEAFALCPRLTRVTLSGSVKKLASHAFANCTSLKDVSLPRKTEALGDGIFRNCAEGLTVHFGGTKEEWIALAAYQTREGRETVAGPLDHYPYYKAGGEMERCFEYTVKFDRGIKHLKVECADGATLLYGEALWN